MELLYDPSLVEEVVFWELKRQEETGNLTLVNEYYRLAEPFYQVSLEERAVRFQKLHETLFRKLGFTKVLEEVIEEFPIFCSSISTLLFGKAITLSEEGADLARAEVRYLGIKLRPQRFLDIPHLQTFLRHECMHIYDLLDPEFGYQFTERIADHPAEEALVRQRYKVLWDLTIESRLIRQGKATLANKENWYREFATLYILLPPDQSREIFETLWQAEKFTHRELLELARNPLSIWEKSKMGPADLHSKSEVSFLNDTATQGILLPGAPCPLCCFPTYRWGEDLDQLERAVLELIRQDYPAWKVSEGICTRCLEAYRMKVCY